MMQLCLETRSDQEVQSGSDRELPDPPIQDMGSPVYAMHPKTEPIARGRSSVLDVRARGYVSMHGRDGLAPTLRANTWTAQSQEDGSWLGGVPSSKSRISIDIKLPSVGAAPFSASDCAAVESAVVISWRRGCQNLAVLL